MPEINVTTGSRLPGADDTNAPAISFGEGATDSVLRFIEAMGGWVVQFTDEHGSFDARLDDDPTGSDDRSIWSIRYHRAIDLDNDEFDPDVELMPLDRLLRMHVW